MSFSAEVKSELASQTGKDRHCQLAELAALISFAGKLSTKGKKLSFLAEPDHSLLKEKCTKLTDLLFCLKEPLEKLREEDIIRILESIKMWDAQKGCFRNTDVTDGLLVWQSCCRRAFIRGAFLAAGSISDPKKAYHFEIVCRTLGQAEQLKKVIDSFGVEAKIATRKKNQIVYVKEGAHLVDLLNIMEAHVALMNLENVRIVKEVRNFVNRQVNCETANISKTVNAAIRQIEDIRYIRNTKGLESLPDSLREVARLRLEYPDTPLKELGTYLSPPVGKSGVNHRLRRISEIAAEMGRKEENV